MIRTSKSQYDVLAKEDASTGAVRAVAFTGCLPRSIHAAMRGAAANKSGKAAIRRMFFLVSSWSSHSPKKKCVSLIGAVPLPKFLLVPRVKTVAAQPEPH